MTGDVGRRLMTEIAETQPPAIQQPEYVPAPVILNKMMPTRKRDGEDAYNIHSKVAKYVPQPKPAKLSSDEQMVSFYDPIAETLCQSRFVLAKQMNNMSKLPYELLVEIAKRLKMIEEFTCFRSVSRSLHLHVAEEHFEGLRFRKSLPYLMLPPVSRDGNDDIRRQFYSLVEGESIVASLEFPKFKTTSKMYFESLGWLLTVEVDGSMSLVDPFSDTEIPVPHLHTYPELEGLSWDNRFLIRKMVLSSRPNETSDFIMMVIIGDYEILSFWRLGDKAWNKFDYLIKSCCDVVHGGGEQFYVICAIGTIWAINFAAFPVEFCIILYNEPALSECLCGGLYILKAIDGSLLAIKRSRDKKYFLTNEFRVFDIEIETGTWKEIYSLGSMAIFIGRNSTIALDATASSNAGVIKANHIYFTDDFGEYQNLYFTSDYWRGYAYDSPDAKGGSVDSGVFNFETEDVEAIYPVEPLLSNVCPAMWITPNLAFR